MERISCAFYSDLIRLNYLDIFKLLFGRIVKSEWSGVEIGLDKWPETKCRRCKEVIKSKNKVLSVKGRK